MTMWNCQLSINSIQPYGYTVNGVLLPPVSFIKLDYILYIICIHKLVYIYITWSMMINRHLFYFWELMWYAYMSLHGVINITRILENYCETKLLD